MKTQNNYLLFLAISLSILPSCNLGSENSKQESNPDKATNEELDLTGSWKQYNTKLESFNGMYQNYDMESGNQVFHFTKDSLFIISDNLELVLRSAYKVENGYLFYSSLTSDEKFNVKKEIDLKGNSLELKDASMNTGAITFQYERTEIDLEQLEYLKEHIIDWRQCIGTWVYANHQLPSEDRKGIDDAVPDLSYDPLEFISISEPDNTCEFVRDTFYYTPINDTTPWWIFVFEHHYANEGEPRKLLFTTVKPKEERNQILEYHKY